MTSDTTLQCAICGDAVADQRLVSECVNCNRTFHLNPYNSGDHRDCGDAIIGPSQGVEFWCQICLEQLETEAAANRPDPRAALDELAAPGALFPRPDGNEAAPPAPPPARDAPPRRGRTPARRRYRRIDR